mmetsp:Transcript_110552/g.309003  ORF Transcript_110552/g.309003 Transcript_110552/m.309003 type:complete len:306 (+) Transcript_110552:1194-2111(+)
MLAVPRAPEAVLVGQPQVLRPIVLVAVAVRHEDDGRVSERRPPAVPRLGDVPEVVEHHLPEVRLRAQVLLEVPDGLADEELIAHAEAPLAEVAPGQVARATDPPRDEQGRVVLGAVLEARPLLVLLPEDEVASGDLHGLAELVVVACGRLLAGRHVDEDGHDLAEHGDDLHEAMLALPGILDIHTDPAAAGVAQALQVKEHELFPSVREWRRRPEAPRLVPRRGLEVHRDSVVVAALGVGKGARQCGQQRRLAGLQLAEERDDVHRLLLPAEAADDVAVEDAGLRKCEEAVVLDLDHAVDLLVDR